MLKKLKPLLQISHLHLFWSRQLVICELFISFFHEIKYSFDMSKIFKDKIKSWPNLEFRSSWNYDVNNSYKKYSYLDAPLVNESRIEFKTPKPMAILDQKEITTIITRKSSRKLILFWNSQSILLSSASVQNSDWSKSQLPFQNPTFP